MVLGHGRTDLPQPMGIIIDASLRQWDVPRNSRNSGVLANTSAKGSRPLMARWYQLAASSISDAMSCNWCGDAWIFCITEALSTYRAPDALPSSWDHLPAARRKVDQLSETRRSGRPLLVQLASSRRPARPDPGR